MRLHPARVLAIAHRDLRIELGGRRLPFLPVVSALVLFPLAGAPHPSDLPIDTRFRVGGDVPESVRADPAFVVVEKDAPTWIRAPRGPETRPILVRGGNVPRELRKHLDALESTVPVVTVVQAPLPRPKRSFLLALVSASMLTGALAQSIPGERSQRTLETLMTAAVSRIEIVLGKWLAWGGFGALASMLAMIATVAFGRQEAGPWMLAVPWTSLATVALGLWLVRGARDVVGGATIALRALPAALTVLGAGAWWLGTIDPLLGAFVPIGGSLIAAGDTWPGWGPVLLSVTTTGLATGLLLGSTARGLDAVEGSSDDRGIAVGLTVTMLALTIWWTPLMGPFLWAVGGTLDRTSVIPPASGQSAATLGFVLLAMTLAARDRDLSTLGVRRWRGTSLAFAGPALLALGLVVVVAPWLPGTSAWLTPMGADALARVRAADLPRLPGLPVTVLAVIAQEFIFRGWMRTRASRVLAVLAWALVVRPADPIVGVIEGVMLEALAARTGSILPGIGVRVALLVLIAWS